MKKLVPGLMFVFLFSMFTPVHMTQTKDEKPPSATDPGEEIEGGGDVDITLGDVIGSLGDWIKEQAEDIGYYDTGITIYAPPLLRKLSSLSFGTLGKITSGWGLRIDWGRPSVFEKYPLIDIDIINEESETAGSLAEAALGVFKRKQREEAFRAKVAARTEGKEFEEPSLVKSFISDFTSKDHPWFQYSFSILRLMKHAWDQGMIKEALTKVGLKKGEDQKKELTIDKKRYLTLLWEFMRHNIILVHSLKDMDTDHEYILESMPEFGREILRYASASVKKNDTYIEDHINDLWYNTWRYYKATYDPKNNVQNIGPAVYAFSVASKKKGEQILKDLTDDLGDIGDWTFDTYMRNVYAGMLAGSPGQREKERINGILRDLKSGNSYQSFGLVDEQSKVETKGSRYQKHVVPQAIVDQVKMIRGEKLSITPQLKLVSSGRRHWVIFVTTKLDFAETNKLVFAIVAQAVIKSAKEWEKSLGPDTQWGKEYKKINEKRDSLTRVHKTAKQFLDTKKGNLKDLAKASKENVEDEFKKLFEVKKKTLAAFEKKANWPRKAVVSSSPAQQLAAKENELTGVEEALSSSQALVEALSALNDAAQPPAEGVEPAVEATEGETDLIRKFLADEEAAATIRGFVVDKKSLVDEVGLAHMSALGEEQQQKVRAKIAALLSDAQKEHNENSERKRTLDEEIVILREQAAQAEQAEEAAEEKAPGEKYIFKGNQAVLAINLMQADFDEDKIKLAHINSNIDTYRTAGKEDELAQEEAAKTQILAFMERKADWIKDNLHVVLQEKQELIRKEQNLLEAVKKEGFSKLEKKRIEARIKVLKLMDTSIAKDETELNTKSTLVSAEDEDSIMELVDSASRIVGVQKIGKSDERFWVRAVEGFEDFLKKVRNQIPRFNEIQEQMVKRLEAVASNSMPFRTYTGEYMLGIQLLGEPFLNITKEQRTRLRRAGKSGK